MIEWILVGGVIYVFLHIPFYAYGEEVRYSKLYTYRIKKITSAEGDTTYYLMKKVRGFLIWNKVMSSGNLEPLIDRMKKEKSLSKVGIKKEWLNNDELMVEKL